jgi:hypothetical protein
LRVLGSTPPAPAQSGVSATHAFRNLSFEGFFCKQQPHRESECVLRSAEYRCCAVWVLRCRPSMIRRTGEREYTCTSSRSNNKLNL